MTYYLNNGNRIDVFASDSININETLEAGLYSVNEDMQGIYLSTLPPMSVPSKLYGSIQQDVDRIINTYNDRCNSTGVLLIGEKGSGKTLLAKLVSNQMIDVGVPVLVIKSQIMGDLSNFLSRIDQEIVIMFDEFEKIYDEENQQRLLSIFDGIFSKKRMYLLTANDASKISDLFKNRPGRVFYVKEYDGLEKNFIKDYVSENLVNKNILIEVLSNLSGKVNFDMLQASIEEINRYEAKGLDYAFNMLNTGCVSGGEFKAYIKLKMFAELGDTFFHIGTKHSRNGVIDMYINDIYYSRDTNILENLFSVINYQRFKLFDRYDNSEDYDDSGKRKKPKLISSDVVKNAVEYNKFYTVKIKLSEYSKVDDSDGGLIYCFDDYDIKLLPSNDEY